MAEKFPRSRFDEAVLLELAEALALGEPIPERLAATWELIGHDPEALARVEELRAWWLAMREGATAAASEPDLVLQVDRRRGIRIEVLHAATSPGSVGDTRPVLAYSMGRRVPTPTVVGSTVRFQDLKLSISERRGALTVRILAGRTGRAGVEIEALDAGGSTLAKVTTGEAGTGALDVEGADRVVLAFSLRSPRRNGDPSASPQV